ncbi:TrmB family transcriptional regulator sugar-binding domain-containing protein [Halobaculum sp. EA56]|uniref:TrmB family transcriptional regulator sugar-binding domain-containing protein n=1 Tax=Halobaculum sp. EA56 TaxID=3421648 RepID=UPI003EBA31EE
MRLRALRGHFGHVHGCSFSSSGVADQRCLRAPRRPAPRCDASLTLATDRGEVTVGGWRATIEDVAATSIQLSRPRE